MKSEKEISTTFEEAVNVFDYGRAVVMFQARLPADFWESMTIYQRVQVYTASFGSANDELAKKMLHRISNSSFDFSGWKNIYGWAPPNSELQLIAKAKMIETAGTVEHWQAVYHLAPPDGDHKKIALEKIEQLTPKK